MPARTNLFQQVVLILHEHLAGDATVEESARLKHRVTGKEREVDVVVRSTVAAQEVILSVEATAKGRKADVTWVEGMLKKHSDLPTSKLVLVSEAGFTEDARTEAKHAGAVPLTPEDLSGDAPAYAVVNALSSLWPKTLELQPEEAVLVVQKPDGTTTRVKDLKPDHMLYLSDGRPIVHLVFAFKGFMDVSFESLFEQIGLRDIAEDTDKTFVLEIASPWQVQVDGTWERLYLCWHDSDPPELHQVESGTFTGKAIIRVFEMPLHHRRLGEISYSYGESQLGDHPLVFVASESSAGSNVTARVQPGVPTKKKPSR